jgi:flagellar protein FlbD
VISLHRLNGSEFTINAELIESLETQGVETVVSLATGNRVIVRERREEIVERVIDYRRRVNALGPVTNPIRGYERNNP